MSTLTAQAKPPTPDRSVDDIKLINDFNQNFLNLPFLPNVINFPQQFQSGLMQHPMYNFPPQFQVGVPQQFQIFQPPLQLQHPSQNVSDQREFIPPFSDNILDDIFVPSYPIETKIKGGMIEVGNFDRKGELVIGTSVNTSTGQSKIIGMKRNRTVIECVNSRSGMMFRTGDIVMRCNNKNISIGVSHSEIENRRGLTFIQEGSNINKIKFGAWDNKTDNFIEGVTAVMNSTDTNLNFDVSIGSSDDKGNFRFKEGVRVDNNKVTIGKWNNIDNFSKENITIPRDLSYISLNNVNPKLYKIVECTTDSIIKTITPTTTSSSVQNVKDNESIAFNKPSTIPNSIFQYSPNGHDPKKQKN